MSTKKTLVVDDSPTELARIKSILSDAGCLVITACNGKQALDLARSERPAVIFMDIVMPDMDGFEACRLLSEDANTRDIPVVFVSSKSQPADKVWGQIQGAKGYITKPYRPEDIIDGLKALA